MTWLVRGGDVLAAAEVATSGIDRARGLWHRPLPEGALIMRPPVLLHTFGAPGAVDIAFCDAEMAVMATLRLGRFRAARPRRGAKTLIVARDGAFERWRLVAGDEVEVVGTLG